MKGTAEVRGVECDGIRDVSNTRGEQAITGSSQSGAVSLISLSGGQIVPGDNLAEVLNVSLARPHLNLSIRPSGAIPLQG